MQNEIIYVYWLDGTIEQMTSKRYHEDKIYLKKQFFWSNNPNTPDWSFRNGKWVYTGKVHDEIYICQSCGTASRNCIC